ncbi:MAG: alpha/beta hydrolase [Rhodoferax sp.]|nr:alpha/beta hydrolase [Rhodoferax sp.]
MDDPVPAPQTWVFLRGLTRSSAHWAGFVAEFEESLQVRVLALDLPGNGRLWRARSPASVAGMVQHVRAQLQQLGVAAPVSLLAMSLGGMVAAAWALQQPHEIRELVLINTSMRPFNPAWQRLRPASLARLFKLALGGAGAQAWEREILLLTTRHPRHEVLADWCVERLRHPVSAGNTLRQLLAAARYRAPLQGPSLPTLVLSGAADALVSPQCSHAVAQHWQTSLQVHPTAGHDLTLDAGPWVIAQMGRWQTQA